MHRRILLASAGVIALAGSAFAADLPSRAPPPVYVPPAPIFTWTGIYIGGQIGYAWGTSNTNLGDSFGDFTSFSTNNSGVIGGAHVGYNLQLSQFVVGLEGDVDGSSLARPSRVHLSSVVTGPASSSRRPSPRVSIYRVRFAAASASPGTAS